MSESATVTTEAPRPPRSRASARQGWVERLDRFSRSGLSAAQFCVTEGVSLPSFYSWRRRLDGEARSADTDSTADTQPGPRLLPVHLASVHAVPELVLPSGAVLRVSPGCDLAFVRSLVEALGDAPC
jgi:transposase